MIEFRIKAPGKVECTATITLTLAEWRNLRDHIMSRAGWASYPMEALIAGVTAVLEKAEESFNAPEVPK